MCPCTNEALYILTNASNLESSQWRTSLYNNVLIRSGEAPAIGWSRYMLYSGFNVLPRSVFWPADLNGRSDNTDVIRLVDLANLDPAKLSLENGETVNAARPAKKIEALRILRSWEGRRPNEQGTHCAKITLG